MLNCTGSRSIESYRSVADERCTFCAVVATYRCIGSLCFDVNFWLLGGVMFRVTSVDMCTMVVCVNVKFVKCVARSIVSSACRCVCRDCCHSACWFYSNLIISDVRFNICQF